jgi:DNA-binding NtrC family response regulator
MHATRFSVLLAGRDTTRLASVAQVIMRAGASVSMLQLSAPEQLISGLNQSEPSLLVMEWLGSPDKIAVLRQQYPKLPIVLLTGKAANGASEWVQKSGSIAGVVNAWALPLNGEGTEDQLQEILQALRGIPRPVASSAAPAPSKPSENPPAAAAEIAPAAPAAVSAPAPPPLVTGANPRMREIRETIEKVSGTDVTVLVRGESGVGKEVVARLVFEHSRRRHKPFVKVNCAAIPHDLLESELFGYEPGAFTGAVRSKPGKFELADNGTLFLDEIAEMHPALQAKLLHVLQDGSFSRLGAKRDVTVDVRIICATNKDLEQRVKEGLFREDLLYRINVVTVFLPPLRERSDEIPALTEYLLHKYASEYGRPYQPFSEEAFQRMMEYDWPGNIRELENLCKRYVLVGNETQILRELSGRRVRAELEQLKGPSGVAGDPPASGLSLLEVGRRAAWQAERVTILETLEATHWNRREASRRLQVSYKALLNKVKQMRAEGIVIPDE